MRRPPSQAALGLALLALALTPEAAAMPDPLSTRDLSASPRPLGALGRSLGSLVAAEGALVDGESTRRRADMDKTFLRVDRLDGQPLDPPVLVEVQPLGFVRVPERAAGTRVRYRGYETGAYTGIPSEAFEVVPMVAHSGFAFSTWFVVCKDETP